jgi:hypothetical protein
MRNGSPFMLAWLGLATPAAARTERCEQAALQSRAPASTASFSHSRYGDATPRRVASAPHSRAFRVRALLSAKTTTCWLELEDSVLGISIYRCPFPDAKVRILRPSQPVLLQRLAGAARCSSITDRRFPPIDLRASPRARLLF